MLTLIRQMLRSKAAGALFVLLIVAMAAWGVTDVFSGGLGSNLMAAGDRKLSSTQFDNIVERELRTATDDRGRSLTKEQALERGLIDQLLQREQFLLALDAYADKVGLTVTQDEIRQAIVANDVFHDTTGVFDPARYDRLLRDSGFTSASYEQLLESELTQNRLRRLPEAALQVPIALARVETAFQAERRGVRWMIIPADQLPEAGEPTEEDIQLLYDELGESLREPERRAVSLLRMSPEDFTGQADVLEEDIRSFYDAYKLERYTGPDTRTFTVYQFTNEASARAGLGRIAGGADASEIEGLSTTAVQTGRAELIDNDILREQVFGAAAMPNAVFGPRQDGPVWTVIRLEEIIPGDATPFEEVRDQIAEEIAREQATELFYQALPRFDDLIGTGSSLEDIGRDLGVPVLSFAPVDARGATDSGAPAAALQEAPGLLTQLFDRTEGELTERLGEDEVTWMARLDRIVPARLPSLEERRDLLTTVWTRRETQRLRDEFAGRLTAEIENGDADLDGLAEQYEAVLESPPAPVSRTELSTILPGRLATSVFNLQAEGDVLSTQSPSGDVIIIKLMSIARPDPSELDARAAQIAPTLRDALAQDLFEAYFSDIQREVDLQINQSAIASYKRSIVPVE